MERKSLGSLRGVVGAAGAALVVSVFLPWADAAGGTASAWGAEPALAVLCVFAGLILDTVTRGRREVRRLAYLALPAPGSA